MKYCTRCVYPAASAVTLQFDDNGVCSGCRASGQKKTIDWKQRSQMFRELFDEYRSSDGSNYDCIIPVSGGKDSYFQTHVVTKIYGMKPLLVTYHGNNYTPEGTYNLERMRHVFNVDHIIFRPSEEVLIKLNRLGLKKMGDMNWHNHVGIYTYPAITAIKHRIPILIWGEHGRTEVGGMYSLNDFIEVTAKYVLEHCGRGFKWSDMIEDAENLQPRDLTFLRYPTDDEIFDVGMRGIHINNYIEWNPNEQAQLMMELYGWKSSDKPFERTYRRISNLDDMHENGAHDYLKFVKFGYGRCTDHACKDVREGKLTREQAIDLVRNYDHVRPSDLNRWCDYTRMSHDEFDSIADTFRSPKVWWIHNGEWWKDNVWGEPSSYGPVKSPEVLEKFQKLGLVK